MEKHTIRILQYSSNNWLTEEQDIINALKDILHNNSADYSYNKSMAQRTVEYFNIKL